jgi:hypothetical protein
MVVDRLKRQSSVMCCCAADWLQDNTEPTTVLINAPRIVET